MKQIKTFISLMAGLILSWSCGYTGSTDLSAEGTANCYLISHAGNYKFKAVIGNTDYHVGYVKSVEVLSESFGTDEMPVVGVLIDTVSYRNGYVHFSTPKTFANGKAVIAVKDTNGEILWNWQICCSEDDLQEQIEGGTEDSDVDDDKIYNDLSAEGTANCYLISQAGDYKFKAVRGNMVDSVGGVKEVEVLWESFGTDVKPKTGDLIASVSYHDGYVFFSTPETFANGNAVIAVRDFENCILWSWHIWCSEEGWQEQVYLNDAGTMMDRNLGATSATPGDVGALGLLYQWGRKDPFLASSSISSTVKVLSTGYWHVGNFGGYIARYPTDFFGDMILPSGIWSSSKTVYDPCPVGWRVPDGGSDGVWAKASLDRAEYDSSNNGLAFNIADGGKAWYPASGYLRIAELSSSGSIGCYWSVTPYSNGSAYGLGFNNSGKVKLAGYGTQSCGFSVRCLKE